ncbi:hypothetical protein [Phytohabitans rumicis]|nr:hypothetical protein [Phytohabitans rumicis]
MTEARTLPHRSRLALLALAAILALLGALLLAGAQASDPGAGSASLATGTVKPKPPPR